MPQDGRKKAIWWFFPSLLEPCDGPWGRLLQFGHDPVRTWKAIIDWAAALKVDRLIPGIEPYQTDRVYNQWGFHYVCRFPEDPEARCFDAETIERNVRTVRAIAAYGQERGVRILFHHYNLMAPERWVQAHPRLWEKVQAVHDPVWGNVFHNDRLGNLVANLCWNDPAYQAFLQRCWREVFTCMPELAGAMITAGEFNYCGCDDCTGGSLAHIFQGHDRPESERAAAEKARREDLRGRMIVDLIRTFTGTLEALGKEPIVRNWVVSRWLDRMPRGVQYATKYSVFDACWGGPDPVIHEWTGAGHRMWETLAIEAENSGPVLWHDEDWCRTTAGRLNALPIEGCILHINTQWGHAGHVGSFTASRNITRLLEQLSPEAPGGGSAAEFAAFFGAEAGPVVCEAARKMATFPLRMTETVHLGREGFSYGMPPWFDGRWRWPGVLGGPNYQAPDWANPDGLTGLHDLVCAVAENPASYAERIERCEGTVLARCDAIAAECAEAARLLEGCPPARTPEAQSEIRALAAGASIAEWAAREHGAVLRARVAWEAVKRSPAAVPVAVEARDCAADWYARAVEALARQIPAALEMAQVYPDLMHHIAESRETLNRLPLATRLRIRREELHRIRTTEGPDWETAMTVEFWPFLPASIGSGARR